ncbi:hypothetical protein V2J94_24610 [Streptomyces sp. DSM 41524]|uniref:AG2 protein n=1 Tax=Streptomyces asiaticus subsp. ignotus TaxID=3098222 RepID=A0ABU7Q195_9ACTN|nr:hypothetical protein [Streptomyces sp. DSM 41524]
MVSYHDLLKVNLQPLSDAVDKWRNLPDHFTQVSTNFTKQVTSPITNSDWEGKAAEAAADKIKAVAKQMEQAALEAKDMHGLLSDAHTKFKDAKKKLKGYKDDIEADKNLVIDEQGRVSYKPTNLDEISEQAETLQAKRYSETVSSYNDRILQVLSDATAADEILHWALAQDFNGRGKGFTGDGFNSIKGAEKGREQAYKDLKTVTELAKLKGELSTADLEKVNSILSKHEGDPLFSEKFAVQLGAKGTLQFWEHAADTTQTGGERTKTLEKLQKSLGFTLATASHSDSKAIEQWKRDVINLGPQRLDDTHSGGPISKGPYGFQAMSSLLRYGEYDKDFLYDYGKGYKDPNSHDKDGRTGGLIEFDRKHKDALKGLWSPNGYTPYLSFGKGSDQGMDPMAGYMEALGRNPEAAQSLFYRKGYEEDPLATADPDLKYLLQDRNWPNGNPLAASDRGYGYDELGHALEAATLGHPYDQPELGLHRTPASANVMAQAVVMVAENSGLAEDKPGLSDSLARMGAGYIDNLDWATANYGDKNSGSGIRDAAFGAIGEGDILVTHQRANDFLSAVGRDDDSYKILSVAQQEFTTSAVKAHPQADDSLIAIFGTGAETQGILDEARADAITSNAEDTKAEQARKLSEAAEWKKYGVSQGIGSATSLITMPLETARYAPFVTPFIDGAAGAMETHTGIQIDREMERRQEEIDTKIDRDASDLKKEFIEKSQRRSAVAFDSYVTVHPEIDNSSWYARADEALKNGYDRGVGNSRLTDSGK